MSEPPQLSPDGSDDATRMMRYDAAKSSTVVAYLLWFFLGMLGAHRFYLRAIKSGVAMLLLWVIAAVIGVLTLGVGYFLMFIPMIWWVVDLFLIPGMVRRKNDALIDSLSA